MPAPATAIGAKIRRPNERESMTAASTMSSLLNPCDALGFTTTPYAGPTGSGLPCGGYIRRKPNSEAGAALRSRPDLRESAQPGGQTPHHRQTESGADRADPAIALVQDTWLKGHGEVIGREPGP